MIIEVEITQQHIDKAIIIAYSPDTNIGDFVSHSPIHLALFEKGYSPIIDLPPHTIRLNEHCDPITMPSVANEFWYKWYDEGTEVFPISFILDTENIRDSHKDWNKKLEEDSVSEAEQDRRQVNDFRNKIRELIDFIDDRGLLCGDCFIFKDGDVWHS